MSLLVVRRARVDEIFPLRHAVLRPGRRVSDSVYAEDDDAVHVGAWEPNDGDGDMLVGCATVFPEPWTGTTTTGTTIGTTTGPAPEPRAWRLRGMAVDPSRQGTGIGGRVLAEAVGAAREAGAPLLWANARTTALRFYQRNGWVVAGEEYVTTDTGLPHYPIVLLLDRSA